MLSSGNNLSRVSATNSSEMPPLPQCLPLEPITLDKQKYPRPGELRRVLGVPSTSEDHSFGVAHSKIAAPVGTDELKHLKKSVQDGSRKARYNSFTTMLLFIDILTISLIRNRIRVFLLFES